MPGHFKIYTSLFQHLKQVKFLKSSINSNLIYNIRLVFIELFNKIAQLILLDVILGSEVLSWYIEDCVAVFILILLYKPSLSLDSENLKNIWIYNFSK